MISSYLNCVNQRVSFVTHLDSVNVERHEGSSFLKNSDSTEFIASLHCL